NTNYHIITNYHDININICCYNKLQGFFFEKNNKFLLKHCTKFLLDPCSHRIVLFMK
ncbi:hypothetical protein LDENG_00150330, partial [Lucifuga dentata]